MKTNNIFWFILFFTISIFAQDQNSETQRIKQAELGIQNLENKLDKIINDSEKKDTEIKKIITELPTKITEENLAFLLKQLNEKYTFNQETYQYLESGIANLNKEEGNDDKNSYIKEFTDLLYTAIKYEEKEQIVTFKLKGTLYVQLHESNSFFKSKTGPKITQEGKDVKVIIDKVSIEIRDGEIFHIEAITKNGEIYSNKNPINILKTYNYSLTKQTPNQKGENDKNRIFINDFLSIQFKVGKRYIIERANFELTKNDPIKTIEVGTNLKGVIDFRVYSDFLGLIDESSNGIASFEGNSVFYLNPFSIGRRGFNYLFKKFKAGVNYSRFDSDDSELNIPLIEPLDLIQKSFLTVHTEVDVFETRLGKKFPYKILGKARGNIRITETFEDDSEDIMNTTTLGLGFGTGIEVERFSNFGVNASIFFNRYQNNNIIENDILNFETFSVHSEAYFYVPDSDNAFFLRLKYEQGRRNLMASSNFFNLQFGYKAELNFNPKK